MDTLNNFKLDFSAKPCAANVVLFGNSRFTVITSQLIRMEYNPEKYFEDRPTQTFFHRDLGKCNFTTEISDNNLTIDTEELTLKYRDTPIGFDRNTLTVLVKATNEMWHYSYFDRENLLGTARTLDGGKGAVPLEEGLLSRRGFYCVNDTERLPIDGNGFPTENRLCDNAKDLYLFGYGHNFNKCLQDFFKVSGEMPMLPRFAFGNWWSRYWKYTDSELKQLITDFESHEIPLSTCIVDMDWHIVENDYHLGWTGYTFNKKYFPNHTEFIQWLHDKNLKVSLNLHPSEGVAPFEEMYERFCEEVGVNPNDKGIIPFDITDKKFVKAYFDVLHHPYEDDGVDFWWMDWQQGTKTKIDGLDPLWMLNHLHFQDSGRNKDKRPFFFSRWCGLGGHRYQIGFSGDAMVTWEMLAFEPYFTATSSNVGNFFWSHDIGGHYSGVHDPELYIRWVQYGVFSPILRLHSCQNPLQVRVPWAYESTEYNILKSALTLRHNLIPYIYTSAYRAHCSAEPLVKPMYYTNSEDCEAYACKGQYWFGGDLIVAPVCKKIDDVMYTSRQSVWLPKGSYYDFFSGEHYTGGRHIVHYTQLNEIPVFAKSGAIIPLDDAPALTGTACPEKLRVRVFPGNGKYELFEDDGISQQFKNGKFAITEFILKSGANTCELEWKSIGDLACIENRKSIVVEFMSISAPIKIDCTANDMQLNFDSFYSEEDSVLTITLNEITAALLVNLKITTISEPDCRRNTAKARLERQMKKWRAMNDHVWSVLSHIDEIESNPAAVLIYAPDMPQNQQICVLETLQKQDLKSPVKITEVNQ